MACDERRERLRGVLARLGGVVLHAKHDVGRRAVRGEQVREEVRGRDESAAVVAEVDDDVLHACALELEEDVLEQRLGGRDERAERHVPRGRHPGPGDHRPSGRHGVEPVGSLRHRANDGRAAEGQHLERARDAGRRRADRGPDAAAREQGRDVHERRLRVADGEELVAAREARVRGRGAGEDLRDEHLGPALQQADAEPDRRPVLVERLRLGGGRRVRPPAVDALRLRLGRQRRQVLRDGRVGPVGGIDRLQEVGVQVPGPHEAEDGLLLARRRAGDVRLRGAAGERERDRGEEDREWSTHAGGPPSRTV